MTEDERAAEQERLRARLAEIRREMDDCIKVLIAAAFASPN